MLTFAFRGTIADIDETTSDEPCHPSVVLIVEIDESFSRVVVPESVLEARREFLCVGRPIHVLGEVKDSRHGPHHVATEMRLVGTVHGALRL
jgi:hypothetical protein